MNCSSNYFLWFRKLISVLIDIFFYWASIVTLYVFVSNFTGSLKYILFGILLVVYGLIIYFFRNSIKSVINKLYSYLSRYDEKQLLLFIVLLMIILKVVYTFLFGFDATTDSDIKIYNDIAQSIIDTGKIQSNAISHLFGTAIHFALFKFVKIPLHVGMFLFILLGTVINFISFKDIIGKEKTFLAVLLYIIMPSTSILSMSPTHEIFVYTYISIFVFLLNKLITNKTIKTEIVCSFLLILDIVLLCMVNPAGMISYVVLVLLVVLSNIIFRKKIILICILLLSIFGSNLKDKYLNVNSYRTTINTYTILIHGSNPESLGEQVDGYPLTMMRKYMRENNLLFTEENYIPAAKGVLINQYKYLLTHPLTLLKLICHKTYILWSGDHYPIEMGYHFSAYNTIVYYCLLAINTLIYLFGITMGWVYRTKNDPCIRVCNYKLIILGTFAVTLISIVLNKYDLYITLFLYFIVFYNTRLKDDY